MDLIGLFLLGIPKVRQICRFTKYFNNFYEYLTITLNYVKSTFP
uniref:Uncharacterized protein n=1 Tax=Geladintestivirus 2 TaxID=3233134 RepID=A0AAU8MJU4_9CAUD